MKVLGEYNAFRFDEFSVGTGYLYASAIEKGVQLQIQGYDRTTLDHVNFGFSPEEAAEIRAVADSLIPLVPDLEIARREHNTRERQRARARAEEFPDMSPYEVRPLRASAPVVHAIQFEEGSDKIAQLVGGDLEPDELVVVGGLTWARDQLILRFDEVDTLVFRPEAFGELALIGANQPDFPPAQSIWSRLGK